MLSISITDKATPQVQAQVQRLSPAGRRQLMALLGRTAERAVKDHFRKRELGSPNKQGFPRTHFWRKEGFDKTAVAEVTPDRATVTIGSAAIGFKLRGGTIRPGPGKKALAIPLTALAYGRRPSENHIPGLFVRRRAGRAAYLATREGKALRVHYLLLRSVTQRADHDTLPDNLRQTVLDRAARWLAARDARSQPKP